MNLTPKLLLTLSSIIILLTASCKQSPKDDFSQRVKLSLRTVGDRLLRSNKDTTSLVLPVVQVNASTYELAFKSHIKFKPEQLVNLIDSCLQAKNLPKHYIVETIQCLDYEVAYSYQIDNTTEHTVIPCKGRELPEQCYTIKVEFTKTKTEQNSSLLPYLALCLGLGIVAFVVYKQTRKPNSTPEDSKVDYQSIGRFKFYPDDLKLMDADTEIKLSKKECEILSLLTAQANQIITREELTKKVWEDQGVVVGRSLDTYISKLRKKLKADASITITNVHGVGYKLEIKG